MPENKTRRLAAIMFTDIAGYTRLMQESEAHANQIRERHREVFQRCHGQFNGEILQYYGDGTLSIFDSCVDAVRCAVRMQQALQETPVVPLRIGIHLGDVIRTDSDVFGDGVNVAARVENLSVPHAILISEDVQKQIQNQGINTVSMGSFQLKNVQKPLEVFAVKAERLVVPNRKRIRGKVITQKQRPSGKWLVPLVTLILAATGFFFWQKTWARNSLPEKILESRIAVLPYENNTNDTTLHVLGDMAADWITRNLIGLEGIKVVQFDNVKNNLEYMQENPGLFINRTGAEHMIKGKFYLEGEELIFESQIVNPQNLEVVFVLPVIRGNRNSPSEIVSELSQRVVGYFAFSRSMFKLADAPKLEAFVALEEGNKYFGTDYEKARSHYQRAAQLDTTFVLARLFISQTYANQGNHPVADSLLQRIKEARPDLSWWENKFVEGLQAIIDGDLEKEFQLITDAFKTDPKNFIYNYQSGYTAIRYNRPQTSIAHFKHLDPAIFEFDIPPETWWFGVHAQALTRLGRYQEALKLLRTVPPEVSRFFPHRQQIFTLQNQSDSLEQLIIEMEEAGVAEDQILGRMFKIAFDYGAAEDKANQLAWGKRMLARIQNRPESLALNKLRLAQAYFITEDYENTIAAYEDFRASNGETWGYLVDVGSTYAKMGEVDQARAFIRKLREKENKYSHGQYKYAQALIYASLNEKEEAVSLLKQAFREGYGFGPWNYNYSYHLVPLHGYPAYEEFVRPK